MIEHTETKPKLGVRSFFQDERTRNLVWQFVFFIVIVLLVFMTMRNVIEALTERDIAEREKDLCLE